MASPPLCSSGGRSRRRALVFATFLAVYGNGEHVLWQYAPPGGWPGAITGLVLVGIALVWARAAARLEPEQLGLRREGAIRGSLIVLLAGTSSAAVVLLLLHLLVPLTGPLPAASVGVDPSQPPLWRALLWIPLDTAIPEEVAFRGVLLADLRRAFGDVRAGALALLPFGAWHGVFLAQALSGTTIIHDALLGSLAVVASIVTILAGGAAFTVLRLRTQHRGTSVFAHWSFNALLLLGLVGGVASG